MLQPTTYISTWENVVSLYEILSDYGFLICQWKHLWCFKYLRCDNIWPEAAFTSSSCFMITCVTAVKQAVSNQGINEWVSVSRKLPSVLKVPRKSRSVAWFIVKDKNDWLGCIYPEEVMLMRNLSEVGYMLYYIQCGAVKTKPLFFEIFEIETS